MSKKKARTSDIRVRLTKAQRESLNRKSGGKPVSFAKSVILKACSKERKGGESGNRTRPNESAPPADDKAAAVPDRGQLSEQLAPVDFQRFIDDTGRVEESDRGCVLVAAGYADVALEHCLKLALLNRSELAADEIEALISAKFAPIGDLWSRTLLAFSLGLITVNVKEALDELRTLRNFFAHHPGPVDLSDERVYKIVDKMDDFGRKFVDGDISPDLLEKYSPSRFRFILVSHGIYAHLNALHYQLQMERLIAKSQPLPETKQE